MKHIIEREKILRRNKRICIGVAGAVLISISATVFALGDEGAEPAPASAEIASADSQDEPADTSSDNGGGEDSAAADKGKQEETDSGSSEETGEVKTVPPNKNEDKSSKKEDSSSKESDKSNKKIKSKAEASDLDSGLGKSKPVTFPNGVKAQGKDEDLLLSEERIGEALVQLPSDISAERLGVVLKAVSLEGKVSYFWGGKSTAVGWDERWGNNAVVTSEGSKTTGKTRKFGLDCSGYVNWVFNNAAGEDVTDLLGSGTSNQWKSSEEVEWKAAVPGDLAFLAAPGVKSINHVGIVVGANEDGELMVAHCSSSANNVVITEAKSSKFAHIRRPDAYEEDEFTSKARIQLLKNSIYQEEDKSE